jgi:hypothetical protein
MKTKNARLLTSLVITLLFLFTAQVNAQKIELTPFIGYETGAKIYTNQGYLRIGDGMDFGGSLDIGFGTGRYAELSYSHLSSYLNHEGSMTDEKLCDLAVDYYSVGVLQEIRPSAKATPYGLFTLGVVSYRPATDYSPENKMHVSLAGGVKIRATERIGIRLQARLLMPIYYAGTYFSAGTGGAGYGISGGIIAVQGDFTGALVFMLKKILKFNKLWDKRFV